MIREIRQTIFAIMCHKRMVMWSLSISSFLEDNAWKNPTNFAGNCLNWNKKANWVQ